MLSSTACSYIFLNTLHSEATFHIVSDIHPSKTKDQMGLSANRNQTVKETLTLGTGIATHLPEQISHEYFNMPSYC